MPRQPREGQSPPRVGFTKRFFVGMRTEGAGPGREAAAVGLGFFIGCTPLYGLHLVLVLVVGSLLRLNRLKMYIAANISNPLFAPVLVLMQIQLGAWLQRGELHALTLDAIRATDPWTYGLDLVVGSLVLGLVGGIGTAAVTYFTSRIHPDRVHFEELAAAAAERYLQSGVVAWEFARGKLRGDPLYREVLEGGVLGPARTLVDIGCGQGLMLALLAEARVRSRGGAWPSAKPAPPLVDELIGIELRPRIASLARQALLEDATIICADAADAALPEADVVLLFDVLHMMDADEQAALLRTVCTRLRPGGVLLVREADAAGGWGFRFVAIGNRLKAIATGNWKQRFAFRSADEWARLFREAGFLSDVRDTSAGTPFANNLFTLRAARPGAE